MFFSCTTTTTSTNITTSCSSSSSFSSSSSSSPSLAVQQCQEDLLLIYDSSCSVAAKLESVVTPSLFLSLLTLFSLSLFFFSLYLSVCLSLCLSVSIHVCLLIGHCVFLSFCLKFTSGIFFRLLIYSTFIQFHSSFSSSSSSFSSSSSSRSSWLADICLLSPLGSCSGDSRLFSSLLSDSLFSVTGWEGVAGGVAGGVLRCLALQSYGSRACLKGVSGVSLSLFLLVDCFLHFLIFV